MTRVLSYGEALVDFLPDQPGLQLRHVETFRKTIGGAPANAAVGLARLGCEVGLVGKVGEDEFGHFLLAELAREGVDVTGVGQTREAKTGITFVSVAADGDRSFLFFREPSADMTIRREDIDLEVVASSTVFIAGSNLLTAPEVRDATFHAIEHARASGAFVVVDPNVRHHLWPEPSETLDNVVRELRLADVVKLNEEELAFVQADEDAEALWTSLEDGPIRALIITRAAHGAEVFWRGGHVRVEAPPTSVVDTTGAGDGFVAGLVCGLLRTVGDDAAALHDAVDAFGAPEWSRILRLGCHIGTEVCRNFGATPALPRHEAIPWSDLGF